MMNIKKEMKPVSKIIDKHAKHAIDLMADMDKGTKYLTVSHPPSDEHPNGWVNCKYITKTPSGIIEHYGIFGDPTTIDTHSTNNAKDEQEKSMVGLLEEKVMMTRKGEDEKDIEEKDIDEKEEGEKEKEEYSERTFLFTPPPTKTLSSSETKSGKWDSVGENWDSVREYEAARRKIYEQDGSYLKYRQEHYGMCKSCKKVSCLMEKYGEFAIHMANVSRWESELRSNLEEKFTIAYHVVAQHDKFKITKKGHIKESDVKYLPHCVYQLKENWLKAICEGDSNSDSSETQVIQTQEEDTNGKQQEKKRKRSNKN